MKAHYGYEDGSGRYYITVDTDLLQLDPMIKTMFFEEITPETKP